MKKFLVASALALSLVDGLSYAGACDFLGVVITNAGPESCVLIRHNLKHGYYADDYYPAAIIPPQQMTQLFIQDSFFGSELELTYECGYGRRVTFTSMKDYGFFSAGNVSAYTNTAQNMLVDYQTINGSCFLGDSAQVFWVLR